MAGCSPEDSLIGICTDNEQDHVDIEGERRVPRVPQPPQQFIEPPPSRHQNGGPPLAPGPEPPSRYEGLECTIEAWQERGDRCIVPKTPRTDEVEPEEEEAAPEAPVIPTITERDVLTFAPAPPQVTTEPNGVAVVGMPMNVVAPAQQHVSGGSLFELPVTITFTPTRFSYDFGDGTHETTDSGGSTWQQLGLPQFSATPTSHAYGARGQYLLTVSVGYTAVVDFGEWGVYPVEGLVTSTSTGSSVRVVEAHTALVEKSCAENPAGPGC
ncbi:hypothetical protein QWJ90_07565 [Microbacterium oryzae]|uniref:hypothetical protein n=1 Tax=Microbacterium oryzae TaxID=743009 RepID=UPI0025B1FC87|nr:hypothetical protein [Microbacterium oryzae]MDN3310783.1 hypothetical protein [Microbacterium oryzae]